MLRISKMLLLLFFSVGVFAQQPTQTIRGTVTDESAGLPLPGVNIVIMGTTTGTETNREGNFELDDIKVGRYNIKFSFIGYEPVILREISVSSSKEVVLNVTMRESSTSLSEVIVSPKVNKEQPLNPMASVSARMLSVEEAGRYAGGFDDPARLVSAFAGVSSNVGNNAIVVRGNNPQSLQWKLEGIEISNPNHFADLSTFGGGGLTALSTQLLANSDFFSGAMPAEYSNALSGVFDIFMRNGNNQQREHTFQLGAIGIDIASEGPFSKGKKSSYIFNYRYSTLGLLAPILPENAGGTTYQDLSFKLNFPTGKTGIFSFWGMGLIDFSDAKAKKEVKDWKYDINKENLVAKQFMEATGVSHKIFLNDKQHVKTTLAVTSNGMNLHTERLDSALYVSPENKINNHYLNLIVSSFINTKFNERHSNKSGLVITGLNYRMLMEEANEDNSLRPIVNKKGGSLLVAAYSNSLIQINRRIMMNAGLTGQWFKYNGTWSVEPRIGIKYRVSTRQTISFAYGLYSRLERLNYYFIQDTQNKYINNQLGFTKAHHWVAGYDISPSDLIHLKLEAYYQSLFDVPVTPGSSFSLINQQDNWFYDGKLENSGLGRNYGIDLTFEKYLSEGYYYMVTGSLFNSEYRGGDNVWRNTRYDRNFAFNFLFGKEWVLGKDKNRILGLNARLSYQGGDHYSPVDITESVANQDVVFDETEAYSLQYSPSLVSHFTASYKINKKTTAHEIALKVINLTQYKEHLGFLYNYQTKTVDANREATFIPNISYKIEF